MRPADNAVDPRGIESRSRTKTSTPSSCAAKA